MTDAFGNPINPAYSNPNWGIDPSLLTPSYQAPYRPQYEGSSPYNYYGRLGFFSATNRTFNPFHREPYWGNPVDNNQQAAESMVYRPTDAAAWTGQRIIAPALAFGGAYRMLASRSLGGYFTGGGLAGSIGRNFGAGIGRGVGTAFGLSGGGFAGAMGAGLETGMGVAGSVMGNVMLPMMAAQAALAIGQKGIWDPYINTRQSAQSLQRNFAGVTFGDARGNAVTGGGLGYSEANRMAQDITRQGINDMTFSSTQYREIGDLAGRAGLMDNVKAQQITQRVRDVAEQIKMIVAISKDPDIKNAIEELSKLNLGGADLTGGRFSIAGSAYRGLGRYAAQAGTSIQRLMSTVGAQGQYMYQSMGMTPYMGQMAAGNIYASFASAQRIGLMSPAQLARMGGVEGATQASMMGQIGAMQSPYALMALYNQYLGGQRGGSTFGRNMNTIGVVGQFGASMAGNPLQTVGAMGLYAPQMQGNMLQNPGAVENMANSLMNQLVLPAGPNGKHTAEQLYTVLTNMIGMAPDQARAYIAQRASDTDAGTVQQRMRGIDRNTREQMRQYISQNMAYGGALGQMGRAATQLGHGIIQSMSDNLVNPVTDFASSMEDKLTGGIDRLQFGSTLGNGVWKVSDVNDMFGGSTAKATTTTQTINFIGSDHSGVLNRIGSALGAGNKSVSAFTSHVTQKINAAAKAGDTDALAFLSAKNDSERLRALHNLAKNNPDEFGDVARRVLDVNNPQAAEKFLSETKILGVNKQSTQITTGGVADTLQKHLADTVAGSAVTTSYKEDITPEGQVIRVANTTSVPIDNSARLEKAGVGKFDQMAGIGQGYNVGIKLASDQLDAGTIDDELKKPENAQLRALIGNVSGNKAVQAIQGLMKNAAKNGMYEPGQVMNSFVDQKGNHGLQALINSKGGLIQNADLRKQFQQALASGDKAAMNKIALQAGIDSAGGQISTGALKGDIGDFKTYMGAMNIQSEADQEKRDLVKQYKNSQIDYSTYTNTVAALDQKQNTKDFGDAVKKFSDAVDSMSKGGSSGNNGTPFSFFSPSTWGLGNSNSSSGTSRDIGPRGPNSN